MSLSPRRPVAVLAVSALLAVGVSACGSISASRSSTSSSSLSTSAVHTGTADVAYAGVLLNVNERSAGPAFHTATGYSYAGRGGGSFGVAHQITAGQIHPNVFMSVGSAPIKLLEPAHLASWYVRLAASPLVVAYNPKSRYAAELAAIGHGTKPLADLFTLMATPGFQLGRTDPNTDPQGQAFVEMVELAQSELHLPADTASTVLGPLTSGSQIFAETALTSRLQSGQLDAASAFLAQAVQLHLPYIPLPSSLNFGDPALASQYATATLTLSGGATVHGVPLVVYATTVGTPTPPALAWLTYLLSPAGRAIYAKAGFTLLPPVISGTSVPAGVTAAARAVGAGCVDRVVLAQGGCSRIVG
ncbi:MAG: extracellular solute-binding protein, partial [Actinomycetes bacterium]